jgi:hypothetical protein
MTIAGEGNVGIGTTTPDAKLRIDQDAATVGLKVTGGSGGVNIAEFNRDVGGTTSVTISGESARPQMKFSSAGNSFAIGVNSNTFEIADNSTLGTNARFSITNAGNVGIGTTTPKAKLQVEQYGIDTTTTSSTAVTQIAIHTFPIADFRSAKYTIQVTNSTDSTYHITEMLMIHNGTTPSITEYGTVYTGSAAEATFTADISGTNLRLLATPATTDGMTFKVVCHSITV